MPPKEPVGYDSVRALEAPPSAVPPAATIGGAKILQLLEAIDTIGGKHNRPTRDKLAREMLLLLADAEGLQRAEEEALKRGLT